MGPERPLPEIQDRVMVPTYGAPVVRRVARGISVRLARPPQDAVTIGDSPTLNTRDLGVKLKVTL